MIVCSDKHTEAYYTMVYIYGQPTPKWVKQCFCSVCGLVYWEPDPNERKQGSDSIGADPRNRREDAEQASQTSSCSTAVP